MKTQSELKLVDNNGYKHIVLYFKHNKELLRIPTHNKYVKSYVQKDLYYNTSMPDYKKLNDRTKELKSRVDDYIKRQLAEPFPHFSQKDCLTYIDEKNYRRTYDGKYLRVTDYVIPEPQPEQPKTVMQYYQDFLELKKLELKNHYNSYKKYITLENILKNVTEVPLTFDYMNNELFVYKFRDYLIKIGYNDNSTQMKIKNLRTFLRWVQDKKYYIFNPAILKVKTGTYDNTVVTLNKEEIKQLMELSITNVHWQKIVDVFVCNCFMGLRISDLCTLTPNDFIKDADGDYMLIKRTQKTSEEIIIPIVEPALSILQKYQFELPKFVGQYFNRQIQKVLKHYELFTEEIKVQREVNGRDASEYKAKNTLITSHTCRRTFVTMAVNNKVPVNAIMTATGHKKLATIQAYIKKETDKQKFKAIEL